MFSVKGSPGLAALTFDYARRREVAHVRDSDAVSSGSTVTDYARQDYFPPDRMRFNGWWFLLSQAPVVTVIVLSLVGPIRVAHAVAQPLTFVANVAGYAIIFAIVLLASKLRGLGRLREDYGWDIHPIDLIWGIVGVVATVIAGLLVAEIARSIGAPTSNVHLGDSRVWNVANVFMVPVLLAAPIEELAFRGLLMRWIRNYILRRGAPTSGARRSAAIHLSVIASAVCFALFHLHEAPDFASALNLGLQTLILGVINGYLATHTGRLGPAVVTHGLHNALVASLALQT